MCCSLVASYEDTNPYHDANDIKGSSSLWPITTYGTKKKFGGHDLLTNEAGKSTDEVPKLTDIGCGAG